MRNQICNVILWFIKNKYMNLTLSIIIPAYNEEKRIGKTLNVISVFLKNKNIGFEIIVVANNCTDNTVPFLENLKNTKLPQLKIINIPHNGVVGNMKGYAIEVGMREALGEYHLFIDADNATSFEHVSEFIDYVRSGYGVVIASRYVSGANVIKKQPLYRVILSRIGNMIIQIFILPGVKDTQCGFKMFSHECSSVVFKNTTISGWGADLEMLAIAKHYGFKIKEAPVIWESQDESTVRSHAFIHTLKELFIIRKNLKNGVYR